LCILTLSDKKYSADAGTARHKPRIITSLLMMELPVDAPFISCDSDGVWIDAERVDSVNISTFGGIVAEAVAGIGALGVMVSRVETDGVGVSEVVGFFGCVGLAVGVAVARSVGEGVGVGDGDEVGVEVGVVDGVAMVGLVGSAD